MHQHLFTYVHESFELTHIVYTVYIHSVRKTFVLIKKFVPLVFYVA